MHLGKYSQNFPKLKMEMETGTSDKRSRKETKEMKPNIPTQRYVVIKMAKLKRGF